MTNLLPTVIMYSIVIGVAAMACYGLYRLGEWLESRDRAEEARREATRPPRPTGRPYSAKRPIFTPDDVAWNTFRAELLAWRAANPDKMLIAFRIMSDDDRDDA